MAFTTNMQFQMRSSITRLSSRIINSHRTDITSDELLELYTKPEDREILTRVFDLVNLDNDSRQWSHPYKVREQSIAGPDGAPVVKGTVQLSIFIDFAKGDRKWLTPKYATRGPVDGANPGILAKLDKWVTKRIALGVECGMVMAVFDELIFRCKSMAAMKFYMPSVLDFLDMMEGDTRAADLRDKLSTAKVPDLPVLPPALREILPNISATVARARLMDKKSEDVASGKVRFMISAPSKGLGETPWGSSLTIA